MELDCLKISFVGLLILGLVCQAFTKPSPDEETVQDDDYDVDDYKDSESVASDESNKGMMHTDKSLVAKPPMFAISEKNITGYVGQMLNIECPAKNLNKFSVVLWYKETRNNVLSTGISVVNHNYSLGENHTLHIKNVTSDYNSSTYYCEVMPEKINFRAHLTVENEPKAVMMKPEAEVPPKSADMNMATVAKSPEMNCPSLILVLAFLVQHTFRLL